MRKNLKIKIYSVAAIFTAAILYSAYTDSRYWALFFTGLGYSILVELYKIDEIENPQEYKKENRSKNNIFDRKFNIALLLIPIIGLALYGIFFK